jgi:hypothetical protein
MLQWLSRCGGNNLGWWGTLAEHTARMCYTDSQTTAAAKTRDLVNDYHDCDTFLRVSIVEKV